MEIKICLNCKNEIRKKYPISIKQWNSRKYCSIKCAMNSVEVKKKISVANKGKLLGNKNPFWRGGIVPVDPIERKKYASDYNFQRTYGILASHKELLYKQQGGKCFFFGECKNFLPANWRKAIMDHDHKSKKIRKLLCNPCNVAMHGVDNERWLKIAILYRNSYRKKHES